ncbi:MAG: TetR/AcrR family transcriptional regulator [Chloroflexota bacterium]
MTETSSRRGEHTREEIIQAAHHLFIQQGYHGTSMRQIAKKAGIALGGLYNHFDSKEAVFHAVLLAYHPYREWLPTLMNAQGATVEELVRNAASQILKSLQDRPDLVNVMFIEVVEFKGVHIHQLFNELFPYGIQIVQRIVEIGGERLRPLPPPMVVRTFLGMFFAYYLTEVILAEVAPQEFSDNAMEHFVDIYLHGILKPDHDRENTLETLPDSLEV